MRISRDVPGMGEEALAVLGPGQVFGEMALLDESPRSADARVHERCRLLAIPKDGFDDLLFLHKDLAYEVLWSIVRMLVSPAPRDDRQAHVPVDQRQVLSARPGTAEAPGPRTLSEFEGLEATIVAAEAFELLIMHELCAT